MKIEFKETFELPLSETEIDEIYQEVNNVKKLSKAEFNKVLRKAFKSMLSVTIEDTILNNLVLDTNLKNRIIDFL